MNNDNETQARQAKNTDNQPDKVKKQSKARDRSGFSRSLRIPRGALPLIDTHYVERDADRVLQRQITRTRGTTTTIRGPRQSGKSSLLIRGLEQARQAGSAAVFINLEPIDNTYLEDGNRFFLYFADAILHELGLDQDRVQQYWHAATDPTTKITRLMEEYVLKEIASNVILAVDEAERAWGSPISDGFFGLLRHWDGLRAAKDLIWSKLSVLVVISTEPHLVIRNVYQSPFNIGSSIELDDFTEAQVHDLHVRYGMPLGAEELGELFQLLGGHPYLSSIALYLVVAEEMTWGQIQYTAPADRGPFKDHLRLYWRLLRDQPELVEELKNVLQHQRCSEAAYYRLSRAGLVKGDDESACMFRCKLYEDYFRRKL